MPSRKWVFREISVNILPKINIPEHFSGVVSHVDPVYFHPTRIVAKQKFEAILPQATQLAEAVAKNIKKMQVCIRLL